MDDRLTIGFTGDVMIGRQVDKVISDKGYAYPWGNLLPALKATDINIINLETTFTYSSRKVFKVFNFKASPDKVETLSLAKIAITNLANNHILDFSEEGLAETITTLNAARIKHVGAGMSSEEAEKPEIIFKNNVRLGIIGVTDNEPTWKAGKEHCGTYHITVSNKADRNRLLYSIGSLKSETDLLIVSIHWGPNMRERPSSLFIDFAHQMIDHGADIIHGHSAHIFQAIEVYRRKIILYDTGDFVDDYIVHKDVRNDLSFFFMARVNKNAVEKLSLFPVLISNYQVNFADNEEYKWCMARMQKLAQQFGTTITDEGDVKLT
jgi:poly-gamma-glutamate synthesis protein (capsule biosynthesis protein)